MTGTRELSARMRAFALMSVVAGLGAIAAGVAMLLIGSGDPGWLSETYRYEATLDGKIWMPDPVTEQLDEIPVTVTHSIEVVEIQGQKADLVKRTSITGPTAELPPQFTNSTVRFAVDTGTGTYVTREDLFMVADELPRGYFTFPPDVTPDREFPIWIEEMMQPLPARYKESVTMDGLDLSVYAIFEPSVTIWSDSHSQPVRYGEAQIIYYVEPRSGVIVDQESHIIRRSADGKTAFTSALTTTQKSITQNLQLARDWQPGSVLIGSWLPPLVLGLGLLLLAAGIVAWITRRMTAGNAPAANRKTVTSSPGW